MASNHRNRTAISTSKLALGMADAASWCFALVLVSLILLSSSMFRDTSSSSSSSLRHVSMVRGSKLLSHPCDEIYVVGEGETLHTIGDKCGDPFIVEKNPHIHDPDDVFPGLVIKITPSQHT